MKCNNCGNEILENSKFCPNCGTPVSVVQNNEEPVQSISNENSQNSIIRFLKKSPNKNSISNFSKFNQSKNKNKDNIKYNNVNIIGNKSNLSLDLRGPTIIMRKNNTMSIITKNVKTKNAVNFFFIHSKISNILSSFFCI